MIITIDGFAGTGKSTVAKKLAEHLGFIYYDTGAMYRALAYALQKNKVNIQDKEQLLRFLEAFHIDIKMSIHHERRYFVENEEVTHLIRTPEVTAKASEIAAMRPIRDKLVTIQQRQAKGVNAVFEGRDMGTVVFPEAELKIFLTAQPQIRAERRYNEFKDKYPEIYLELTLEQCLKEISERDHFDSTREISPLCEPVDAKVIDTSFLSIEEVVFRIIEFKDMLKSK